MLNKEDVFASTGEYDHPGHIAALQEQRYVRGRPMSLVQQPIWFVVVASRTG
jgi:hypothetical protein